MNRFKLAGFPVHPLTASLSAALLILQLSPAALADGHDAEGDAEKIAPLDAFPVWQTMNGLWKGDLDSFNPEGDHKIRNYNALFRIRIDGEKFHQSNWMYYGEEQQARRDALSRGLAREGEGVELLTNTWGEAADDKGSMKVTLIDHLFDYEGGELTRVVSDFAVVYEYFNPETGALQHLQLNNVGVPGWRVRSAQGFYARKYLIDPMTGETQVDEDGEPVLDSRFGSPRSASFYREVRVDEDRLEEYRADFREQYNVQVRVEAGPTPDAPSRIYRLDAQIHECDWLANHSYDPYRVTAGIVDPGDVDLEAAIPACVEAVESRPDEPRFQYQAGRVLTYAGRLDEAMPYLTRAAVDMDYPQAQYVLGFLRDTGYGGAKKDSCVAARLWRRAALQGLFYAEYSIAKAELEGRFEACPGHRSPGEMQAFLERAYEKSAYTGLEEEIAGLIEQARERGL